jgi:hypothetical protein
MLFLSSYPVNFNKFHNMFVVNIIQIMSMKNKASKAKQRTHHTSGRKSFQAASFDAVRCQFNLVLCLVRLYDLFVVVINCLTNASNSGTR